MHPCHSLALLLLLLPPLLLVRPQGLAGLPVSLPNPGVDFRCLVQLQLKVCLLTCRGRSAAVSACSSCALDSSGTGSSWCQLWVLRLLRGSSGWFRRFV